MVGAIGWRGISALSHQCALPQWVGEAMGDVDFKDLKQVPDKVAETVAMAASSGAHPAGLLKGAGYPGVEKGD